MPSYGLRSENVPIIDQLVNATRLEVYPAVKSKKTVWYLDQDER